MAAVRGLSRYLRTHPDVCDTADGIARWWMAGDTPLPVIEVALESMTALGVLEALPAADGRTRFRRAAGAATDARLAALAGEPPPPAAGPGHDPDPREGP
jgi:hypothetical protein